MMMLMVATAVLERLRMSWGRDLTSAPDSNRSVLRLTAGAFSFSCLSSKPSCLYVTSVYSCSTRIGCRWISNTPGDFLWSMLSKALVYGFLGRKMMVTPVFDVGLSFYYLRGGQMCGTNLLVWRYYHLFRCKVITVFFCLWCVVVFGEPEAVCLVIFIKTRHSIRIL